MGATPSSTTPEPTLGQLVTHADRRSDIFRGNSVAKGWKRGPLIGKGATGAVYEAESANKKGVFAVKYVEFPDNFADNPDDRRRFEALRVEIRLLKDLHHPNIVRFLGLDRAGFAVTIFMEFVPGGSIEMLTRRAGPLPERVAARFTRQVIIGLGYLHEQNIIHRDIKGANILVSDDGIVKLADFGAAKKVLNAVQLQHTLAGTPYWMAPEVVRQAGHSKPADVWSLGATVLQMLTGRAPFQDLSPVAALYKIGHGDDSPVTESSSLSNGARHFLQRCLQRDAGLRPTVVELLSDPWLLVGDEPLGDEELMLQRHLVQLSRSHTPS